MYFLSSSLEQEITYIFKNQTMRKDHFNRCDDFNIAHVQCWNLHICTCAMLQLSHLHMYDVEIVTFAGEAISTAVVISTLHMCNIEIVNIAHVQCWNRHICTCAMLKSSHLHMCRVETVTSAQSNIEAIKLDIWRIYHDVCITTVHIHALNLHVCNIEIVTFAHVESWNHYVRIEQIQIILKLYYIMTLLG